MKIDPRKILSEYGGTETASGPGAEEIAADAAEEATDEARHAEVRRRSREEAQRRPAFGGNPADAFAVVDVGGGLWLVAERGLNRASMSVAMYVDDDESGLVGLRGGWRFVGRRLMLSARQIRDVVPAIREMFDAERMLAYLRGGAGTIRLPTAMSDRAHKVLVHLRRLSETSKPAATREDIRRAIGMTQRHVIAALRELKARGLAERTGSGVKGKPQLWAATEAGRDPHLRPNTYRPRR